ncbi:transcriptional regulator with XRE-family HTH domain [Bosea sp. BE125]|uniref:helix-turn-helix transcriptional regulator n=1 Tax=Bosea sp. BE125 TaxID=2817909 RepID=UPI002856CAF0|nr:helix-turn-helix transcriptional regulator [Bosea sp. BE125]MDR6870618.1 transcriptional regulator with XRE-family HTH domain [Bosea sp. BE125]
MSDGNSLGVYLRSRRTKLDPASFGLAGGRRRTAGLRREEVAQRANISATWYTWLEQGRGGSPSADVLDRIARALTLTDIEREHLFLVGLGRPPEVRYRGSDAITPRLQRLLDVLTYSPAIVRTATWDVVAWNRAAAAVLTDYGALPPDQRNVLRLIFCDPRVRAAQSEWESVARFVVATFRIDAARAGADAEVVKLVDELSQASPEFAAMWRDNNVQTHGDGVKRLRHPRLGPITLEYSAFAVDARPDLSLIVYNPATPADRRLIESLVEGLPVAG